MFKINRKLEYALMALKYMHSKQPGELSTVKEMCESTKSPFDVMARVLQGLAQKGVLRAEHGAHGGYQIIKDLTKLSVLELTEMILGPVQFADCLGDDMSCGLTAACNVISPIMHLNERLKDLYRKMSVRELIAVQHPGEKKIRLQPEHTTFVV